MPENDPSQSNPSMQEVISSPPHELLSGEEAAKIISEIYESLGPENGVLFVAPNAVLAIAGLKGVADLHYGNSESGNLVKIEEVNKQLEERGMKINFPRNLPEGDVLSMTFMNLKGYEYKTKRTKLPGYTPFDRRTGFAGLAAWNNEVSQRQLDMKRSGELDPEVEIEIYDQGICLGYPDQAIIDFEQYIRQGRTQSALVEADILSVNKYALEFQGAVPEFDYLPTSANDPEITEHIVNARSILDGFYKTEWFGKLVREPEFVAANAASEKRANDFFRKRMTNK